MATTAGALAAAAVAALLAAAGPCVRRLEGGGERARTAESRTAGSSRRRRARRATTTTPATSRRAARRATCSSRWNQTVPGPRRGLRRHADVGHPAAGSRRPTARARSTRAPPPPTPAHAGGGHADLLRPFAGSRRHGRRGLHRPLRDVGAGPPVRAGGLLSVTASGGAVPAFGPLGGDGSGSIALATPVTDGGAIDVPTGDDLALAWTGGSIDGVATPHRRRRSGGRKPRRRPLQLRRDRPTRASSPRRSSPP